MLLWLVRSYRSSFHAVSMLYPSQVVPNISFGKNTQTVPTTAMTEQVMIKTQSSILSFRLISWLNIFK